VRTQRLQPGQTFDVPLSDAGRVYRCSVNVIERKKIKTILGRVDAVRVEPAIFGDNRVVRSRGTLSIWITDDARRIPVKAQIKVPLGTFDITLKRATYPDAPRRRSPTLALISKTSPLIIAHRGASAVAPENTLAAFARGLEDDAHGFELDVRLARDGVPVVIHDAKLQRTGSRADRVSQMTSAQLGEVDSGSWFNRARPALFRTPLSSTPP